MRVQSPTHLINTQENSIPWLQPNSKEKEHVSSARFTLCLQRMLRTHLEYVAVKKSEPVISRFETCRLFDHSAKGAIAITHAHARKARMKYYAYSDNGGLLYTYMQNSLATTIINILTNLVGHLSLSPPLIITLIL